MKSKKIICGAVAAALTLSFAFSGCGLISSVNEEDMKQTVATVNIGKSDKLGEDVGGYVSVLKDEAIIKRDLINAFVNVGSNYINSGMTYEATFNTLLDELTNNAVLVQYSTLCLLKEAAKDISTEAVLTEYNAQADDRAKLVYLLGGEESEEVKRAQYNLYVSLNSALDSYEVTDDDDEEDYEGTETRTVPTNIDTTVEDYLPLDGDGNLNYGVYTGYDNYLLSDAGEYEEKDNSNRNTRRRAYSRFVKNLESNFLINEDEEDLTDILQLSYVKNQYINQLEQCVVEKYYDIFTKEQEDKISMVEDGEYTFVKNAYNDLLSEQEQTNAKSSAFETSMGNLSDTSFVLYAPATNGDTEANDDGVYGTFGYVYNILLPFSVLQSNRLTTLQSYRDADDVNYGDGKYFEDRNELLKNIVTTDQRAAWFNGTTDYSFDYTEYNEEHADNRLSPYTADNADRKYLFFENNLTKSGEYESVDKYAGMYTYNGKVTPNKDGSYTLIPNKLTIDDMLAEFSAYINYVLGSDSSVEYYAGDKMSEKSENYGEFYTRTEADFLKAGDDKEIDYSKLVYATGKVTLTDTSRENMFNKHSDRYKAMSAVNELQYAYTTDTGVLSQYIGYTVSAYETSYIKEFEYAAHEALKMGVGAFKVCAGDYGWHLIYVTETFDFLGGAVYAPTFSEERVKEEGTFENLFFEWIKDTMLSNESTQKRTEILQYFATEDTVTKLEKAYKDLLELG